MITEDYVSFETAKLMKEKGFDAECHSHYYPVHYPDGSIQYHKYNRTAIKKNKTWYDIYSLKNLPKDHYLAPTLQMAMKWLREVHNRHISIEHSYVLNRYKFYITKYNPNNISDLNNTLYSADYYFSSYEEACEAAIKYCLENLI